MPPIDRRPKVVVARNLGPDVMPLLEKRNDIDLIVWPEDFKCDTTWLLENVKGATALLVMMSEEVTPVVLDAAGPSLRIVSTMSVGYDHINLPELAKRGIKLGHTPDVLTDAVADIAIMLALMAGRNVKQTIQVVQDGNWPNSPWAPYIFCGPQLSANPLSPTRTAGFLGFGRISQATLARLVPFGITDCIYTSNPSSAPNTSRDAALQSKHGLKSIRRVELDELAKESNVLFILAPGGDKTYHLINESFLSKMKKSSILVNVARGSLVDSDALAKALHEGWIWGAGVDVVEGEPNVTKDHPLVNEPRCVVLPHIGSATNETRVGMATLAVKNLLKALDGEEMIASVDLSE